jgi:hypothetical protein
VRSCPRIVDSDLSDPVDGGWGVDGAVGVQQATVPVVGIFAKTDVACDVQRRKKQTQFFDGKDDGAGDVVGGCPAPVLQRAVNSKHTNPAQQ